MLQAIFKRRTRVGLMMAAATAALAALPIPASAWVPSKPIQFIVPAGTGGGADQMARLIQGIVAKHGLLPLPLTPVNRAAGAGAEGFLEIMKAKGEPHTIIITLSNLFTTPLATGVPFSWKSMTPVAMLAKDQFVLWVNAQSPYQTASALASAIRQSPAKTFTMGGTGSKQEDQIITLAIDRLTAPGRFGYVPLAGGGAVARQLSSGAISASVNNPIEAAGEWKAGKVRPLCIFDSARSPYKAKVTAEQSWSDIPTCKEAGLDITYQMLRGIFLPPDVKPEHVAFYVDLFRKVRATPEWVSFMENGAFDQTFLTGDEFKTWIAANDKMHYDLMKEADLLAPGK